METTETTPKPEVIPAKTIRRPLKEDIESFEKVKKLIHASRNLPPDQIVTDAECFSYIVKHFSSLENIPQETPAIDPKLIAEESIQEFLNENIPDVTTLIAELITEIKDLQFQNENLKKALNDLANPVQIKGADFICSLNDDLALFARRARKFIYEDGKIQNPDRTQFPNELANLAISEFLNNHYSDLKK